MTKSTGVGRGKNPSSWNNTRRGSDHHRWNKGRIGSAEGYIKLRVGVDHPLSDPNGYAYEHLVVWCSAGNSKPETGQTLHHKNEDKTDNRYSNLELLTRGDHNALHIAERGRMPSGQFKKAAGRLLDGALHDEYPEVASE